MSIGTYDTVEVNGSSGSLPTPGPALLSATRPRDLLRLPVVPVPQPAGTGAPETDEAEGRRASGGHCRMSMGYLD
ncbi:hypothetical protein AB0D08_22270 [Kitasatospora sp. NPDC048540]|uniref:hypothetical protein n=1 Tax=unclassified Kitasatospora TaxID=2633591 RepID=UPI0011EA633B|nr:hypothetical protein [Kitasatospora sp. MBT63]